MVLIGPVTQWAVALRIILLRIRRQISLTMLGYHLSRILAENLSPEIKPAQFVLNGHGIAARI